MCWSASAVIFSSMLFWGSISDKGITEKRGFLELLSNLIQCGKLQSGDGVMADKGFLVEKEMDALGLELDIPPFASCSAQMKAPNNSKYCLVK